MADSIRETIVKALVTALNAPVGKPGTTYRTRTDAFAENELPAMVLYVVDEAADMQGRTVSLRKMRVRVEAIVATEPPADQVLDPLLTFAVQTLLDPATFDSFAAAGVRQLQELHLEWATEPGFREMGQAYIDFQVDYTSKVTDPTQKGLV